MRCIRVNGFAGRLLQFIIASISASLIRLVVADLHRQFANMKFLTLAAVALCHFGSASAQQEDIRQINICNPLMYADGHVYKSNDRTMKGFPAQKAFPVHRKYQPL